MSSVKCGVCVAALCGLFALPAFAEGEVAKYHVYVDEACGNAQSSADLKTQIQLRLPRAELLETSVEGAWNVEWVPSDEGCQLNVERGASTLQMPLVEPSPGELENAASQIAWIVEMVHPDSALPVDDPEEVVAEEVVAEDVVTEEVVAEEVVAEEVVAEEVVAEEVVAEEVVVQTEDAVEEVGFAFSVIRDQDAARARIVPSLAINISGQYHGLSGVELGLFNSELTFMNGFQLGLGMNDVHGDVRGVQFAGGGNFAGTLNAGIQLALGLNAAEFSVSGAQIAFGMNHAGGRLTGGQLALGINRAQSVNGGQLSALNLSGDVAGFQVGLLNLASNVGGLQIGLANGAKRGGVQLGLLNVSDTADFSFGLLSIMFDEPIYVTTWMTSQGLLLAGIQHGSKYLKTTLVLGGAATGLEEGQVGAAGIGISGHIPLFGRNYLEIDYLAAQLAAEDVSQQSHMSSVRVVWGYAFGERFAVYAGPALSVLFSNRSDGLNLPPDWVEASQASPTERYVWGWPELHGGIRF